MALPEREAHIALLIDADNAPASRIDVILAELAKEGVANIRRAYGNWKKNELRGWQDVLHEYAIRPMQQFDYSKGKNATDMSMVIDALDLLYTDRPDAFGIVSSDSDFTPLVMHLRAKGASVFGFGSKKTPMPFVNACSRFLYLETLGRAAEVDAEPAGLSSGSATALAAGPAHGASADASATPAGGATPTKRGSRRKPRAASEAAAAGANVVSAPAASPADKAVDKAVDKATTDGASEPMTTPPAFLGAQPTSMLKQDAKLVSLLRNAVENAAGDDGWSRLGSVGKQIANQASFDSRNYGYKKLLDLFEATQLFEIDRSGPHITVRDKRVRRG